MSLHSTTKSSGDEVKHEDPNELRLDLIESGGLGDLPTSGGSANAQTLTIDSQLTAYATGMVIKFKAGYTNTGATTININSIGAKTIKKLASKDLEAGDITANQYYFLVYNGTDFIIANYSEIEEHYYTGTAGEAITAGKALYIKESDGKLYLTDDSADESTFRYVGMSITAGSSGDQIKYLKAGSIVSGLTGLTAGVGYYLNGSSGAISTSEGTRYAMIGIARSSTELELVPPKYQYKFSKSYGAGLSGTETITCGFYPRKVSAQGIQPTRISSVSQGDQGCLVGSAGSWSTDLVHAYSSSSYYVNATINSRTATELKIDYSTGSTAGGTVYILIEN